MPFTRPEAISNRIRLANELGTLVAALVSENGAVDSTLSFASALVDAVICEFPPRKQRLRPVSEPENDLLAWPDELPQSSRLSRRVVPLEE